eukprot:m.328522 g.328522  ORF g.328522 m.328522 type:complete len:187 (+) comp16033_c0_seq20:1196-1756(+)
MTFACFELGTNLDKKSANPHGLSISKQCTHRFLAKASKLLDTQRKNLHCSPWYGRGNTLKRDCTIADTQEVQTLTCVNQRLVKASPVTWVVGDGISCDAACGAEGATCHQPSLQLISSEDALLNLIATEDSLASIQHVTSCSNQGPSKGGPAVEDMAGPFNCYLGSPTGSCAGSTGSFDRICPCVP